jgi:ABC-type Zn uptake system ZnuABC Zn-binding protein ZnuA
MIAKRRIIRLALLSLLVMVPLVRLTGCSSAKNPWEGQPGPPRVVVSFAPLYCFVKNVAGDEVGILSLCSQVGPHDYQGSPEDIHKLRGADLFLTNGLNLDNHFTQLRNSSGNPRLKSVDLGDQSIPRDQLRELKEAVRHGNHWHRGYDPHVWLGIPEAVLMVECIRDELKKVDPARAEKYDQRAAAYIQKLKDLHEEGRQKLQDKKERSLIAFHDYLFYFARSFDLRMAGHITPRAGVSADQHKLTELSKLCKNEGIRVITSEPQYDKSQAQTLLNSMRLNGVTDPEIVVVDPLETVAAGEPLDAGWYERKMRENLDNLAKVLK